MKTKLILTAIIIFNFLALNLFAQGNNEMEKIQSIIKSLGNKYAPDSRTAIFQVDINQQGSMYVLKGKTNIPEAKEELFQKINNPNVIDKVDLLPDASLGNDIYGIINLSVANLRTKPGNREEMASQSLLGTPIKVLQKKKDWYRIQTPDNYISWIDNAGFYPVNRDSIIDWDKSEKVIFTGDFGFSYSKPDENSDRVSDLVIGDLLKYSGQENGFCKVTYPDGRIAFVKSGDCESFKKWLSKANPTVDNILKTAKSFMGIPYLWGGTSVKGMDCSGFTKTTFFLNGIVLPRDASQQFEIGNPVNTGDTLGNLQPGDLLFFGKKGNGVNKDKITHVALYIGDGDYINASGRIKIDSFSKNKPNYSAYRVDSFVGAKRVLNSINSKGVVTISENKFYNWIK